MKRKHLLTFLVIVLVLGALVYLQVREWRKFDWATFRENTEDIKWLQILLGAALIHAADFLRAIRWKIFLRPTRPQVPWTSLVAPQYVGFAGLALLGRPGELVRPYLIAKRAGTTVPAQVALWFVERAFDTGAVAFILAIDLFAIPQMRSEYPELAKYGYAGIGLFLALVGALYAVWKKGPAISAWIRAKLEAVSPTLAESVAHKILTASEGLHAIHDTTSFLQASGISLVAWMMVAFAYRQVLLSFPPGSGLSDFGLPQGIILMGASVVGGVMQLPFIGGGSQLATIHVLLESFGYDTRVGGHEIAVAAGLMFWLVTFISVAPLGLILARFEHVSIRQLSEASESEADRQELDGTSA